MEKLKLLFLFLIFLTLTACSGGEVKSEKEKVKSVQQAACQLLLMSAPQEIKVIVIDDM